MKLDFTFDSDLSQLTEDKSKSLGMTRSMHMATGQNTISPSTAELNLKIASVKKVMGKRASDANRGRTRGWQCRQ